jgi:hypothetical protein
MTKLIAAVGLTALVAVGAITPSAAATTKRTHQSQAYDASAYASDSGALRSEQRPRNTGRYFAHGAPDDPPGSAFQSFGNDRAMGMVR